MELMKKASKYILYARKSTEQDDRQVSSIEDQITEMTRTAEKYGLNIVRTISESASGFKTGRIGFSQLLEAIRNKEADGILCWKLSRIARNFEDAGPIIGMLQRGEIKHIRTYDKDWYPEDNTLYLSVEFGLTNQFSRDLGTDTKRGLRSKAQSGWYPCATLPLGYEHNMDQVEKGRSDEEIIPDKAMFSIIRAMLKELAERKFSPKQVYDHAIANGFRTRKGRIPSFSVFYRIVTHPFYYGDFEFTVDGEKQLFPGKHKPMITRTEHEAIKKALKRGHIVKQQKYFHSFTGLMKCGECGCFITGDPTRVKVNRKGEIRKFTYYHCTKKKGACSQPFITEEDLIEKFGKALSMIHIPEELVNYALEEIQKEHEEKRKARLGVLKNNQKEYEGLTKKLDLLTEKNLKGVIDDETYKRIRDEIKSQMSLVQSLMDTNDASREEWLMRVKKRLSFAERAVRTFRDGSPELKKDIMMELQSTIVIKDKSVKLDLDPLLTLFFEKPNQEDLEKILVRTKTNEAGTNIFEIFFSSNSIWGRLESIIINLEPNQVSLIERIVSVLNLNINTL